MLQNSTPEKLIRKRLKIVTIILKVNCIVSDVLYKSARVNKNVQQYLNKNLTIFI